MRAFGIAAAMLLASSGAAQAQSAEQGWVFFEVSDDRISAYDVNNIRIMGDVRRGWYVIVYKETTDLDHDYALANFDIDCVEETIRVRNIVTYMMDGSSKGSFPANHVEAIVPGSGGAMVMNAVCFDQTVDNAIPASTRDFAEWARVYLKGDRQ